jgi:hypothetical protein
VFTPPSINIALNSTIIDATSNQRDIAFNLGKIMSELPSINGNNKLPRPPMRIGIIIKKIISKP